MARNPIRLMVNAFLMLLLAAGIVGGTTGAAQAADKPLIGLTFDDGPSPQRTAFVLDVLQQKGVKATFFLQGSNAQQYPDLVRRIKAEGHVIGNHSWDHANFPEINQANQRQQIDRTNAAIQAATGETPSSCASPSATAPHTR